MTDNPSYSNILHKKKKTINKWEKRQLFLIFLINFVKNKNTYCWELIKGYLDGTQIHKFIHISSKRMECKTPVKIRKCERRVLENKIFNKTATRLKSHNLFFKNELHTLNKVLSDVNDDSNLSTISWYSLRRHLPWHKYTKPDTLL